MMHYSIVYLFDFILGGQYESKGLLVGSNAAVMSVDFDSTGTLILAASSDFASRVWTVADQRLRVSLDYILVFIILSHFSVPHFVYRSYAKNSVCEPGTQNPVSLIIKLTFALEQILQPFYCMGS
jgi:WD40 repeat protein